MRLPVIIINDCWEYIIEVEVEGQAQTKPKKEGQHSSLAFDYHY